MSQLILVPTPLDESLPLEPLALKRLNEDCLKSDVLILVEEHKVARQRWITWGLPREAIDRFVVFNEHTQEEETLKVISQLKSGKTAYLMSDGGLPAFCDPGQKLVRSCHENHIKVTATPFPNSVVLAVALSGMDHSQFFFGGFLSTDASARKKQLEEIAHQGKTSVIMDTPYRLKVLLEDVGASKLKGRKFFLATHLNSKVEKNIYGSYSEVLKFSESIKKPEFVLVISGS